jgi:hypothetical protein
VIEHLFALTVRVSSTIGRVAVGADVINMSCHVLADWAGPDVPNWVDERDLDGFADWTEHLEVLPEHFLAEAGIDLAECFGFFFGDAPILDWNLVERLRLVFVHLSP